MTPRVLPEAGDPGTWRAYGIAGWPVCLRVPPTWRIGTRGDPHTGEVWEVAVANFGLAEQEGVVALTEALLKVSFAYHRRPAEGAQPSLDQMRDMESGYASVESAWLDDRQAFRIHPLISPVSEEMRVQLDAGQLWITYRPLSSTQQAVLEQILASIDLDQPCAPDPTPTTALVPTLPNGNSYSPGISADRGSITITRLEDGSQVWSHGDCIGTPYLYKRGKLIVILYDHAQAYDSAQARRMIRSVLGPHFAGGPWAFLSIN